MKRMGLVSWETVAGGGSYGRSKSGQRKRVKSRVRRGKRSAEVGFPKMETLNPKLAIYSKFFRNFRRL